MDVLESVVSSRDDSRLHQQSCSELPESIVSTQEDSQWQHGPGNSFHAALGTMQEGSYMQSDPCEESILEEISDGSMECKRVSSSHGFVPATGSAQSIGLSPATSHPHAHVAKSRQILKDSNVGGISAGVSGTSGCGCVDPVELELHDACMSIQEGSILEEISDEHIILEEQSSSGQSTSVVPSELSRPCTGAESRSNPALRTKVVTHLKPRVRPVSRDSARSSTLTPMWP